MKKKDGLLIVSCILIALIVWLVVNSPQEHDAEEIVIIYKDGAQFYSGPLGQDNRITVEDADGHVNVIEIKDGKVYMLEANCPDQICVHTRPAERDGQSIVCLPNKVAVEVKSTKKNEIDGVSE